MFQIYLIRHAETCRLSALQVSDNATRHTHDVCRCCTEVIVPRPRSSPHLVVLQQIGIIISIIAGCLGLIWPKQVSRTIGLQIPGRLGTSEVRATYGGLFIGAGLAVTLIATSDAALVLGAAWAGAFIARAISFVIDKSRTKENVAGLVIEGLMAALLILA
jgi:hypothetical protein